MDKLSDRLRMHAHDCVRAADMDTDAVLSKLQIDDMADAMAEAAAALEAAWEDAERWRHARRILTVEDIETSQDMFNAFGVEGDEHENRKADDAIDSARKQKGQR